MDKKKEILALLGKSFEGRDVRFGRYISFITSIDDIDFISDDDILKLLDDALCLRLKSNWNEVTPDSGNCEFDDDVYHHLTRRKEEIAYDRYKSRIQGKTFFQFSELLLYTEFIERFDKVYGSLNFTEYEQSLIVLNHNHDFYDTIPHRYVAMYVCARLGDSYTFIITHSYKIPDMEELFDFIIRGCCLDYSCYITGIKTQSDRVKADEWFVLVFDSSSNCRATSYCKFVHYGVSVRPASHEIEIYERNQAIEIFHKLFNKCNIFIDKHGGKYNGEAD